ncbi:MAG: hypothetical protein Q9160_008521 [Pyrenula sp. 1 TL-2023]
MLFPDLCRGLALALMIQKISAFSINDIQHEARSQLYSNSSSITSSSTANSTFSLTSSFSSTSTQIFASDNTNSTTAVGDSVPTDSDPAQRPPLNTDIFNKTSGECSGTATDDGFSTLTFFSTVTEVTTVTVTDINVTLSQPSISYPPTPCSTLTKLESATSAVSICFKCPAPSPTLPLASKQRKTTVKIITKKTFVPEYEGSTIVTPNYPDTTDHPGGNVLPGGNGQAPKGGSNDDGRSPGSSIDSGNSKPPGGSQGGSSNGSPGGSSGGGSSGGGSSGGGLSGGGSSGGGSSGGGSSGGGSSGGGSSGGSPGGSSGGPSGGSSRGPGGLGGNPNLGDLIASAFYNPPAPSSGSNPSNQGSSGGTSGGSGAGGNAGQSAGNPNNGNKPSPVVDTAIGGTSVSVDSFHAVIGGQSFTIPSAGSPPQTVVVNGQSFTISPTQITGGGVTVPVPATGMTPMTIGAVGFSVGSSQAIISGTTYAIGPGAASTTVNVNGQRLTIGAGGVVFATTTVPPNAMITSPPLVTVTAGGVVVLVGSTDAVIAGTTYRIGSGATMTTAVINGLTLTIGPGGVGLPSTTIHPGAQATDESSISTITSDGLIYTVDATEAIISGTTYQIGKGATASTLVIGGKTVSLGPSGVGIVSATRTEAQSTSTSAGVFATGAQKGSKPTGDASHMSGSLCTLVASFMTSIWMIMLL